MAKPRIGITCNYDPHDPMASPAGVQGRDLNFLSGDYVYAVEKAGGMPVIIPRFSQPENVKELLETLDGVIFSGGHDVDPLRYGEGLKSHCGKIFPERDEQELAMVGYLMESKKPFLGICRGFQVMNVAQGGTLYQDLVIDGKKDHHACVQSPRNKPVHRVKTSGVLADVFGKDEIWVNSYHHQGVNLVGKGIDVTAVAPDGLVEGIAMEEHPFAVGVQWHPEMMFDSAEQLKLVEALICACE